MMHTMSNALPLHRGLERRQTASRYHATSDDYANESSGTVWERTFPLLRPILRRSLDFRQMDFEAALDEMLSLCFLQPQRIFKQAYYRKQTKNRWARDDPAFAVVQIAFLLVSALASAAALGAQRGITYAYLCFVAVVLHWFTCGVAASSLHASLANRFLREQKWSHSVEQKVEWLYAFDVHCNAFFAYFLVAYVGHFFALPITLGHSFIAMLVANATHTLALSAYFYVTHLGFRTLPYLRRTEVFLYPVVAALALFALSIALGILGIKLNASRILAAAVVSPLT